MSVKELIVARREAKAARESLDEDVILAQASPVGFAWVATRNDPEPYIPENFHCKISEGIVDIEQGRLELLVINLPVQHGKELADSTPVPTPEGWKRHGDLRAGDLVFGADGRPSRVVGISPKVESEYEVTFHDGSSVLAHGEHEWFVRRRASQDYRIIETQDLAKMKLDTGSGSTHRYMYQLEPVALDLPDAELELDPYVLGAWLGDGTSDSGSITHHLSDTAVIDEIERRCFKLGIPQKMNGGTTRRTSILGLAKPLRELGIFGKGKKRIPRQYFRASISQRLELLAGLIDTDGSVYSDRRSHGDRIRIILADADLASDVTELIRTFGWRVNDYVVAPHLSTSGIQGKLHVHYLGFSVDRPIPTKIPRKAIRPSRKQDRMAIKSIRKLEPHERELGHCIQVAAADGLYLAGSSMLPTHNSTTASQWGIAWMLGLHPTWHVIAGTYNTDFAEDKIGRPTRDILERYGDRYFGVTVDPRSHSMKRWNTSQGGQLIAGGVEKNVAGRPSDVFLIDDPYGGVEDAMNPQYRADVWQWFQFNILPRRKPVLRMIAIMSRWHEDDFIAQIIKLAQSSGWKHRVLDFPALAICPEECDSPHLSFVQDELTGINDLAISVCRHQERDELGRLPGEPLWPRVRNLDFLKRQAVDMRSIRMFMALYQGRPQQASGSTFQQHWFRYFVRKGEMIELFDQAGNVVRKYLIQQCRVFQMVDLAAGDTQTLRSGITRTRPKRDFTVVGTFALCPNKELAVLDIFRDDAIDGPDQIRQIGQLRAKFKAGRIGIEAVAYQWVAVQAAVKSGLPVVPLLRGSESKETRAWTIAARYETGQVYHLRDAPWVEALETELLQFPNGPHDDQVDVLSDAGAVVAEAEHRPMPIGVQM